MGKATLFAALAILYLILPDPSQSQAIRTSAREALLIDFDTGAVLFEKNADAPTPPASMSKIMTAYIAFDHIARGHLSLDDEVLVSEKAWRKGGSKMFLDMDFVRIDNILRGIIVQSGNDAAIALAEALAGSEEAFAKEMTEKARSLGMTGSHFTNATGWPDPKHLMTAHDLATLAIATIRNHPNFYPLYAETSFEHNNIKQNNRNPLLSLNIGADGLKTGHTREAGYGLTASAKRDGRRLILVINGLASSRARAKESKAMIEWGFRLFDNYTLLKAGETVDSAKVWLGDISSVPLVSERDLILTFKRALLDKVKISVAYDEPVPAPISKGQRIATLRVEAPELGTSEYPLVAGRDVERMGVLNRALAAISYLLWGSGD